MMATTADENTGQDTKVADDDTTEDNLRDLKYGDDVETSQEEDEPETNEGDEKAEVSEEDGQPADQTEQIEQTEGEEPEFVKQFPQYQGETPEEYAKNLEKALQNSTAEFQRLRGEQTSGKEPDQQEQPVVDTSDPVALFMKQEMDDRITKAYGTFSKQYNQVNDPNEYNKFTNTVAQLSNTILQSEGRLASPEELYRKSAVILGWESQAPSKDDKLKVALKESGSSSKTSSSTKKPNTSKVTDAMITANRKMYPNKSDAEIREELEPYI